MKKNIGVLFVLLLTMQFQLFSKQKTEVFRVFYVNSYHQGYPASDKTEKAIKQRFLNEPIVLKTSYFNGKNIIEDSAKKKEAIRIFNEIEGFHPDLILFSDDDAVKYLLVPYFNNSQIPILYCGVNWSSANYQLNENHIKGMLEVLPLSLCLNTIKKYYPNTHKLGILSEYSLSEINNRLLLDTLYKNNGFEPVYYMAKNFNEWKNSFHTLSDSCDVIYLPTNGAIAEWDQQIAIEYINSNIKVPIVTCDDFMMEYAVFGITKVIEEQGTWIANTAIEILNGRSITSIENTSNRMSNFYWNPTLAKKINFTPDENLKKLLKKYN